LKFIWRKEEKEEGENVFLGFVRFEEKDEQVLGEAVIQGGVEGKGYFAKDACV